MLKKCKRGGVLKVCHNVWLQIKGAVGLDDNAKRQGDSQENGLPGVRHTLVCERKKSKSGVSRDKVRV